MDSSSDQLAEFRVIVVSISWSSCRRDGLSDKMARDNLQSFHLAVYVPVFVLLLSLVTVTWMWPLPKN